MFKVSIVLQVVEIVGAKLIIKPIQPSEKNGSMPVDVLFVSYNEQCISVKIN